MTHEENWNQNVKFIKALRSNAKIKWGGVHTTENKLNKI